MNMGCLINRMCKTLSFHLYNIRRIRKYFTTLTLHSDIRSCIHRRTYWLLQWFTVWSTSRTSQQVATYSEQCCPTCLLPSSVLSYKSLVFLALVTSLSELNLAFKAIHGLALQYIMDLVNVEQQFGLMMLRSQSELQLLPLRPDFRW